MVPHVGPGGAIVVVVLRLIVRAIRRSDTNTSRSRDILDEHSARGDLSADEYHERREHLR